MYAMERLHGQLINTYLMQTLHLVHKQIEQALDKMDSISITNQEKIKSILKRYVSDEIGLDEAYYDLLEEELIPMPQRCGLSAKIPFSAEHEIRLKEKIKRMLF
jgi:hypothetical protein